MRSPLPFLPIRRVDRGPVQQPHHSLVAVDGSHEEASNSLLPGAAGKGGWGVSVMGAWVIHMAAWRYGPDEVAEGWLARRHEAGCLRGA
jgi:hypothetical protein